MGESTVNNRSIKEHWPSEKILYFFYLSFLPLSFWKLNKKNDIFTCPSIFLSPTWFSNTNLNGFWSTRFRKIFYESEMRPYSDIENEACNFDGIRNWISHETDLKSIIMMIVIILINQSKDWAFVSFTSSLCYLHHADAFQWYSSTRLRSVFKTWAADLIRYDVFNSTNIKTIGMMNSTRQSQE